MGSSSPARPKPSPFACDPRADGERWVLRLVFGPRGAAPKSTPVDPTSKMAVVSVQGGDTLQQAVDPVYIPHDIGNHGVATGNDRKLNPQVSIPFPPPALVTDSTRTTLSRWRHGFEPRWDYAGQGSGPSVKCVHGPALASWRTSTRHGSLRFRHLRSAS
jgi:hypothetical protein